MFWGKKNTRFTSKTKVLDQMSERRPLPMGVSEFEEWSNRIISGALIPGATPQSQKFALADMILHLGPTESHKEDAFFIHSLRKFAVNQVADTMRRKIRDEAKASLEKEQEVQKKLELEKRYADQMGAWKQEEKDAFIHARYLEETNNLVKLNSAATPNQQTGVADDKRKETAPQTTNV